MTRAVAHADVVGAQDEFRDGCHGVFDDDVAFVSDAASVDPHTDRSAPLAC